MHYTLKRAVLLFIPAPIVIAVAGRPWLPSLGLYVVVVGLCGLKEHFHDRASARR